MVGSRGRFNSCYSDCNVSGHREVGGLCGYSYSSATDCYATGNVAGVREVGGLIGYAADNVINCYSTGDVIGNSSVGGLVGYVNCHYNRSILLQNNISYNSVNNNGTNDSFIGNVRFRSDSYSLTLQDNIALNQGIDMIGDVYQDTVLDPDYDKSAWLENISTVELHDTTTTMQVGVNGSGSSQISFDSNFSYDLRWLDLTNKKAYSQIQNFLDVTSAKATELGAVSNRLQSVMESISVDIENLTSSLSTIKDADIAQVSSDYIKKQILQQASATLLATANQSPSIALQLI